MGSTSRHFSAWPWAAVLVPWLVARGMMIARGWPETSILADDAYYYFTIARNLAAGLGPTFDGLTATNGFHPLWQFLLVPLFALSDPGDLWTPVRGALALATLFDLGSALLIHRIAREQFGPTAAWIGAVLWLALPVTFLLPLRGMEASVSTFFVLWVYRRVTVSDAGLTARHALVTGLALGLAGLCRTDNLIAVGLAMTAVAASGTAPVAARLRWLVRAAATAVVVTAPWFAWNLAEFGSPVQVSGHVKYVVRDHFYGALPADTSGLLETASTVVHALAAPVLVGLAFLTGEEFGSPRLALALAIPMIAVVALAFVDLGRSARSAGLRGPALVFPLTYLVIHTLLFGLVWRSYAGWYALPSWAVFCVVLGVWIARVRSRHRLRPLVGAVVILAIAATTWSTALTRLEHGARGPELRFGPLLDRAAAALPDGGVLGAFDAGAVGYVAGPYDGLTVTNLDGLVNNAAYEAVRAGRYREYVEGTVDLMLQDPARARMFLPPDEVDRLRRHFGVR